MIQTLFLESSSWTNAFEIIKIFSKYAEELISVYSAEKLCKYLNEDNFKTKLWCILLFSDCQNT